jgi:hypothetical protein
MLKRKLQQLHSGVLELYLSLKEIDEMPYRLMRGDFTDRQEVIKRYKEERRLKLVPPAEDSRQD